MNPTTHTPTGQISPKLHERLRLRLPLIAAPMLAVSGPELVSAACAAGVVGAFPTANARTTTELDQWLTQINAARGLAGAPCAPNLIMRSARVQADVEVLVSHRVSLVITSVGSPAAAIQPLHEVGALILADVATLRHARRAIDAGADGLILLTAGAGGQTGWMNPFAFVRAVRSFFDGPIVLAGGISDGHALRAAIELGCDLAYMGTAFISTEESRAAPDYKRMLVDSTIDDITLTRAFTGLPTNMLAPSIAAAGLDPDALDEATTPQQAAELFGPSAQGPHRWSQIWSAGHSVSGVGEVSSVDTLVARIANEYNTQFGHA